MEKIKLNGNIGSLLSFYKHEKNIFGRCPHCSGPFRLSEVKLTYGKEPPRDMLTRLLAQRDQLEEKIKKLDEEIREMEDCHDDALDEHEQKWIQKVGIEVEKRLIGKTQQIRKDSVAKSRVSQLGKTLEKLAPMFPGFGHHPYDVRPIFDPIDFVVFDGYFNQQVTDITFVEFKTGDSRMSDIQKSIRDTIKRKRVHFEERRLSKATLDSLTKGKTYLGKQLIE